MTIAELLLPEVDLCLTNIPVPAMHGRRRTKASEGAENSELRT